MNKSSRSDPLGRVVARKRVGAFIFVEHAYPELAQRDKHSHPWLHLSIVQRGHYTRTVGGAVSHHRPGTVALLPTDKIHTDSYAPGSRCLHIVIPAEVERRLTQEFARGTTHANEFSPLLSTQSSVVLYREFEYPDSNSALIVEAVLLDLISRDLCLKVERSRYRPHWLAKLLEYLDESCDEPGSLNEISTVLGIHPVYLCRAFSQHMNLTLGQYVRRMRVLRAWQLLSFGQYERLADLAAECGFADESHFQRAFKKQFGASPGRYWALRKG